MRWARALFELASEKGVLDAVERDVEFLGAELDEPAVAAHLFDARVPLDTKRTRLAALKPHLQGVTDNFLRMLLDKRRIDVLRELPQAFHTLSLERRGAVEGVVEAPRPLDGGELVKLQSALGARLGKTVTLKTRVAPELIAGVRVFVAGKLIDQSAVGRLEDLRGRMLAARLP
jgi:F-type H+-transporting ATPase subunit delta